MLHLSWIIFFTEILWSIYGPKEWQNCSICLNQTAHTNIYMSPLDSTEIIDFANKHSTDQFGQRSIARSDWVLM